jgi:alpha-galactosidase
LNTNTLCKAKFNTVSIALLLCWSSLSAQINDLVKTPPMGWNSWNVFHENINEVQIKGIADAMVTTGMRDAGYIYLNLDDNWMATSRDANGNLRADPQRFPSGMKALGDYIHSKGLKFGIYGDRGLRTCHHYNWGIDGSQSGSYGNEERDANTFASWGVDYLKYDNCDPAPGSNQRQDYERMRDALLQSGRDIVYSICAWGFQDWMPSTGNLWRTTGDITNAWETEPDNWFRGVVNIFDLNEPYAPHAKPGAWNDPDMLQVGNGVLTVEESKSHMSLWAIMAAPLIAGNDLRSMDQTTVSILTNPEMIAVNQDSAGIQGRRVSSQNGIEIWSRPLGSEWSGVKAVALLNRGNVAVDITVNFAAVDMVGAVLVRDIWEQQDMGVFTNSFTMSVPAHGTGFLHLSTPLMEQEPFAGLITLPGVIQMENYDVGGQGVSYFDNDAQNEGAVYRDDGVDITGSDLDGYKVGWTTSGEWLEYSVYIEEAGEYYWKARVSTGMDTASFSMALLSNETVNEFSGEILVNSTGDWDSYVEISGETPSYFEAGEQVIRVTIIKDYVNLDWIAFYKEGEPVAIRHNAMISSENFNTQKHFSVFTLQGEWICDYNPDSGISIQNHILSITGHSGIYVVQNSAVNTSYSKIVAVGLL